jgi:3-oxoadipate enol-lactonase
MILRTPLEGYLSCCQAIAGLDLVDDLPKITAPTLVISGDEDKSLPPEHGKVIADGIADARFEVVEGVAHLGNYEQPGKFNELIIEGVL